MKFIKHILFASFLGFFGAFTVGALAQQGSEAPRIGTVTEPLGDLYKTPRTMPAQLSRITLYRATYGYGTGVTSVQVNGHYHTSLLQGSYTDLCLSAPVRAALSSRLVRTGDGVKNYADATTTLSLKAGQEAYVRVSDVGNGRAMFAVVDASTALYELKQTRRQIHAVSRVEGAQSCEPDVVATPVAAATQVEAITLGADALFAFGKSDADAISPEGRAELDRLVARLQKQYGAFDKAYLQVVGYADPLGTPASNKRLSAARAETIKNYMVAGGIASSKISSEGRGSASPIVANCPREVTPQSIACNKPNRRVVVGVSRLPR